jgi:hypothetical protein
MILAVIELHYQVMDHLALWADQARQTHLVALIIRARTVELTLFVIWRSGLYLAEAAYSRKLLCSPETFDFIYPSMWHGKEE